jgi:phosphate:Na+ symporter
MEQLAGSTLELGALVTGLGGGLALFLYGMRKMTEALKVAVGGGMKELLARLTTNRVTAVLAGALVTAVIQSSSVTTVMVISFVSAGLMTFTQSIGVIMGANIGTTVTAQIIAFKITDYALVLIAAGFLMELLGKTRRLRYFGIMVMGLGLLFFGMDLMSEAARPLRSHTPFIEIMQEMRNPLLGIAAGAIFTALVQSSSATTGIVIVLASQGFIALEAGIALVLGANVGTCVTALLSAIGKPRDAVKAAMVHVVFNLGGALIWVGLIPQLADLVRGFSPAAPELMGAARLAAEVPRQIANAHTLFNVANALVFIGLAGWLAILVERIVPGPREAPVDPGKAIYLDKIYLDQPAVALDRAKLEINRLGTMVLTISEDALFVSLFGREPDIERLARQEDAIDALHAEIIAYLDRVTLQDLVAPQPARLQEYIAVAGYLENIGDVVQTGFLRAGMRRIDQTLELPTEVNEALQALNREALFSLRTVLHAFKVADLDAAQRAIDGKAGFDRDADALRLRFGRSLASGGRRVVPAYSLAVEHLENLKRVRVLARRIAQVVLERHLPAQPGADSASGNRESVDRGPLAGP